MEADAVARALALVGSPFRLHGRNAVTGLDCVGVVGHSFRINAVPRGYAVRTADVVGITQLLYEAGFEPSPAALAGRVALTCPGPAQCHLIVLTTRGYVHADAGLGRVVECPGRPDNVVSYWQFAKGSI